MLSIRSAQSDRELRLSREDDEYFTAEISGFGFSARVSGIHAYPPFGALGDFFERLAALPAPWLEPLTWESLDREFTLSAVCNSHGAVLFKAGFAGLLGGDEEWQVSVQVPTELGSLTGLAAAARNLMDGPRA